MQSLTQNQVHMLDTASLSAFSAILSNPSLSGAIIQSAKAKGTDPAEEIAKSALSFGFAFLKCRDEVVGNPISIASIN